LPAAPHFRLFIASLRDVRRPPRDSDHESCSEKPAVASSQHKSSDERDAVDHESLDGRVLENQQRVPTASCNPPPHGQSHWRLVNPLSGRGPNISRFQLFWPASSPGDAATLPGQLVCFAVSDVEFCGATAGIGVCDSDFGALSVLDRLVGQV